MATKTAQKILVKLLLIGDYGVGKTSILLRYTEETFTTTTITSIGVDFKIKTIELNGKKYKLQIWDLNMSGTRVKCAPSSYYRGTRGVFVVYDITDSRSFDNIRSWLNNVKEVASSDVEVMLLGNKCDEDDEKRQVTYEQGQQMAEEYEIKFLETSAKENINVDNAFSNVIEAIIDKTDFELPQDSSEKSTSDTRKSGCNVL